MEGESKMKHLKIYHLFLILFFCGMNNGQSHDLISSNISMDFIEKKNLTGLDLQAINRKYSDVVQILKETEKKYPHLAKVFDLGVNDDGIMIRGISIGSGSIQNMVVATHHGNEYGSTELALALIQDFVENPIKGQTLHIIPVLNISGYDAKSRREHGEDPNRNYPGPCATEGPFTLKSTKALADFVASKNIIASTTLHTFSPAVLYPWGLSTKDTKTEYDQLFIDLGNAAAIESKYPVGNSTDMLYPADGTYEDYAFWKHGIWSMLFELGFSHNPNESAVAEIIRGNVPGIRRYFEKTPSTRAERHAFTGKCDVRLRGLRALHHKEE